MDNKKKNYIMSAEEARKLADSTELLRKRIFKLIYEVAQEAETQFGYGGIQYTSKVTLDRVIKELLALGYSASIDNDTNTLIIKW